MRVKWKASSRSMVPMVTPRVRCKRSLTHSTKRPMSSCGEVREARERASSQVEFSVSHNSDVSVPRTARAFSRAARRQLRMLPANSRSSVTNSNTARGTMTA